MNLQEMKLQFDALSSKDQWAWILANRVFIDEIILDNDNTSVHLHSDADAMFALYPKADCGNRNGVLILLRLFGFNANHC